MPRLIIVSNRVPNPGPGPARAGGLAVALASAIRKGDLWFGWSGERAEQTSAEASTSTHRGIHYATIDLSDTDCENFYVGYANSTLWPLFHFRPGYMEYDRAAFDGYVSVNRSYARALAPLIQPGDLVWVHDYHLIPLATELRALGISNRIGFFLHVPFVPASLLETVPNAKNLLHELCAYDVVAFKTERNVGDFRDCVRRMLDIAAAPDQPIVLGDRRILPLACPIGIDAKKFASQAARAAKGKDTARLMSSLVGRKLVIGVDRLDYSKGLTQRFDGYARLLDMFPEHRQKVSYLQVAALSRSDVSQYQRLKIELDRKAGEINGRFAEYDWVPLRYITRTLQRNILSGFYHIAKAALVTPLRDGMNLVAKEFVAAQPEDDPGVLILSAFAGAAEELTEALTINPLDADEIAEALHAALNMPLDERIARHRALREKVVANSARAYCERFLRALQSCDDGSTLAA